MKDLKQKVFKKGSEHLVWFILDILIWSTMGVLYHESHPVLAIIICSIFSMLAGMQLMRWIDVNKPELLENYK